MKRQERQKIRQTSPEELKSQLQTLQMDLAKARNELKLGKLKNLKTAKNIRYEISLIKTVLREKELTNQTEAQQ